MSLVGALQPFVRKARGRRPGGACELCGASIDADHPHLADVERRALACACRGCALLFTRSSARSGSGQGRWRTVPDRHLRDPSFAIAGREWEALGIPVSMAFFFKGSAAPAAHAWTAVYPSPAGPVESLLRLDAWESIARRTKLADAVERDVEALLVAGGPDGAGGPLAYACMLVPIHACYALVGRVRRLWRGFDGGEEARRAIAADLDALRARCEDLDGVQGARPGAPT